MKTILLMQCGRVLPPAFKKHCLSLGYELRCIEPATDTWRKLLPTSYAVMLLLPAWGGSFFLAPERLWCQFLLNKYPHLRLCFLSYQARNHSNHIDLLNLAQYSEEYLEQLPIIAEMKAIPNLEGVDLYDKLKRFFAGHGQDSVVVVLTRIRLVVQMASREVLRMDTPYEEIYADLVEPAQLHIKWTEWRNRWLYYNPLFKFAPFADNMEQIEQATSTIEEWMSSGGLDVEPLKSGQILEVLNKVRTELKAIEEEYVVQKLSHTYS